jgi:alpha-1,3-rhamnosyl/mannosyltransferase
MRLLINALPLAPPLSGIGTCVSELGQALERHPDIDDLVYMAHWYEGTREDMVKLLGGAGQATTDQPRSVLPGPVGRFSIWLNDRGIAQRVGQAAIEWRRRPQRRRLQGYLYHEMNYIPVRHDGPLVITIQDLSYLHYPETFPRGRLRFFQHFLAEAVQRADHLVTSTEYVRSEVIEHFRVSPERVTATPLGLDHLRFHAGVAPAPPDGLRPGQYFLMVGNLEPRKNLALAIEAFEAMPAAQRGDLKLVHVGPRGWKNTALEASMRRLESAGSLIQLGYVSRETLPGLYRGALALVFPSLYEGFGLPVLEAMAVGTPVVASDCPALVEVGGTACLHFPGTSAADLAAIMLRLVTEPELRAGLKTAGLARAANYSWARCAADSVAVYQRVLSSG